MRLRNQVEPVSSPLRLVRRWFPIPQRGEARHKYCIYPSTYTLSQFPFLSKFYIKHKDLHDLDLSLSHLLDNTDTYHSANLQSSSIYPINTTPHSIRHPRFDLTRPTPYRPPPYLVTTHKTTPPLTINSHATYFPNKNHSICVPQAQSHDLLLQNP